MNISLPDKCLSMDSHVMGVDTPHDESITSGTAKDETFILSSFSFQTNLSRNAGHNGDFDQKIFLSHHFPHQQSHL